MSHSEKLDISPEELVRSIYTGLLSRGAEATGMAAHLNKRSSFKSDALWISALLRSVSESEEFASIQRHSLFDGKLFVERSQGGEVELVLRDLISRGIDRSCVQKLVVDVGASGKAISNSYDILKNFNIKGVLIEANPEQCNLLAEEFSGLQVDVINAAVSNREEEVTLWVSRSNTHIASIVGNRFDDWRRRENFKELTKDAEFKLRSRRLGDILDSCGVSPSFLMLTIDIEGLDCLVLDDLFRTTHYRPLYLIVEGKLAQICRDISEVNYSYDLVAETKSNLIFRKK